VTFRCYRHRSSGGPPPDGLWAGPDLEKSRRLAQVKRPKLPGLVELDHDVAKRGIHRQHLVLILGIHRPRGRPGSSNRISRKKPPGEWGVASRSPRTPRIRWISVTWMVASDHRIPRGSGRGGTPPWASPQRRMNQFVQWSAGVYQCHGSHRRQPWTLADPASSPRSARGTFRQPPWTNRVMQQSISPARNCSSSRSARKLCAGSPRGA
jgi:hypothetical protein